MPKLNSFFEKENKIEQIMTKKMHPQLISYKNLNESRFQYKEISKEDVEKLADLIEIDGEVLQPLLVRKTGGDTYEILAGHKRFKACKYLSEEKKIEKFSMIPCYVKQMTDAEAEFAVYSTNGYSQKSDYEIMREIEGMSRLIKENPEAFPEAASGRLVEKLSKVMNMSKTVVQEYKTVSSNLSDEAMEKFKKNEITKEAAKTLASVPAEEQKKIIDSGVTETKAIKDAVKTIKNPSASEIKSAFKAIYDHTSYTKDVIRKYSSLEECFRDKEGKTHSITEEEFTFDKLVKRKYPSFEKRKVKIEWISYFDYFKIKKITDVQLRHALLQSYAEFKIDKKISGTQADSLDDYVRAYDEIDWQEMEYRMIKEDYAQYKMYLPLLEKKEKVWNSRRQEKYLSDYFFKKKLWPMVEVADLTGDGVSELVLASEQGDLILSRQGDKYYIYDGFMEQGASTRIYEPEGIIEEPSDEQEEAKYNKLIWKDGRLSLKQVAKLSSTNYIYHFEIGGKKVAKSQFKKWSEKYAQKEITVYILSTKMEKNK